MSKVFTITEGLENMGALKTGGQGSVYKARRIGKILTAVKLLPTPIHSETLHDKHFTDFQNEVQKLKKVNEKPNPNVVKILSSGITESGAFPFIEMEFIEGPDLEELLKPPHDAVFTIREVIKVAEHLSNALAHCHSVDVKHGDIKSNNVKFNIHTGNYVLLDFGLAIMSDEQRRTSLRHAGAIEFMAPEQNEGKMLFQTDIYSFGIILFELLAGTVPFPLKDKGETARNLVRIAHMESPPPDLHTLRQENIPSEWSEEKKEHERMVPKWLLSLIYKCVEKNPQKRFSNGAELKEYVSLNSTLANRQNEWSEDQITLIQNQNKRLQEEKEQLQELVLKYQQIAATLRQPGRNFLPAILIILLIIAAVVAALIYFPTKKSEEPVNISSIDSSRILPEKPRQAIGQYKVLVSQAYFHNSPEKSTRRVSYLIPSNDVITALDEKNGFVYTEFTNSRGQTSKGWIRKLDLISLENWAKKRNENKNVTKLNPGDVSLQLQDARMLMQGNELREALYIYNYLAEQEVPEAMYHYGNLALQGLNTDITCEQGLQFIRKASDKDFTPAKRTLGFLYLFAENGDILQINGYDHCQYEKDYQKGSRLLVEAVAEGDTTAKRLLDEINRKIPQN
ncbi:MAG: protein kinase [Chitinophagaceae bacterium]|nr:protein kinase [Chitinophagaceae bacterium]